MAETSVRPVGAEPDFEGVEQLFDRRAVWAEMAADPRGYAVPYRGHVPEHEHHGIVNGLPSEFFRGWAG
jgi:hypothetical protein